MFPIANFKFIKTIFALTAFVSASAAIIMEYAPGMERIRSKPYEMINR